MVIMMTKYLPMWFCTNVGCLICPFRRDFECLKEEVINGNREYIRDRLTLYLKLKGDVE